MIRGRLAALVLSGLLATPLPVAAGQTASEEVAWTRQQAEQGDADAQYLLGLRYSFGHEVLQNDVEASSWYRKAADQDHVAAQFHLGFMYDFGQGVPQDDAQAMAWYRKAADRGHTSAQANLSVMYSTGQGVPRNYVEAYKWRDLVASLTDGEAWEQAEDARDALAKEMTTEQVVEGQRLAREWLMVFAARQE